jgi:ribonuclease P protein component
LDCPEIPDNAGKRRLVFSRIGTTVIESRFCFGRASRLLKPSEFQVVFDARQAGRGQWLTLHRYLSNATGGGRPEKSSESLVIEAPRRRLGLVIAKRLVPASARRNLVRRVLREYFRTSPAAFPPGDWIIRLHESPFRIKKGETKPTRLSVVTGLRRDLTQLLNRVTGQMSRENKAPTS